MLSINPNFRTLLQPSVTYRQFDSSSLSSNIEYLSLGEGNFSQGEAWIARRIAGKGIRSEKADPDFASKVVLTEYKTAAECTSIPAIKARIDSLVSQGVKCLFRVDATRIDTIFAGHHFKSIRWSCPDVNQGFCISPPLLAETIKKCVIAASKLQEPGDTLHFTLIQPDDNFDVWQVGHYGIADAVEGNGYVLKSIKKSGPDRYTYTFPNGRTIAYHHQKTLGDRSVDAFQKGVVEFIFTRTLDSAHRTSPSLMAQRKCFRRNGDDTRINVRGFYYNSQVRSPISSVSDDDPSSPIQSDQAEPIFDAFFEQNGSPKKLKTNMDLADSL